MNPTEQRQRHTAVRQLAADVEVVLDDVARTMGTFRTGFDQFRDFATENLVRHDERLSLCDEHFKRIEARFDAMNALTFWQRLRWLFTGK